MLCELNCYAFTEPKVFIKAMFNNSVIDFSFG